MITIEELLKGKKLSDIPKDHRENLQKLLPLLNKIREKYGKPMSVTSGYRGHAEHIRIYEEKAAKEKKSFDMSKVPMGSAHLFGLACDFADPKGELDEFCNKNQDLLEALGLWQEHPSATVGWLHLDCKVREVKVRPGCLKRQFLP